MKRTSAFLVAGILALADPAASCSFHNYAPDRTVIDRLLETENVVLARPADTPPFAFEAIEALEGTLEQSELPDATESQILSKLSANPADTVLFVRDGGAYGPFVRVAYVDAAYREMLAEIMARKADWIMGDDLSRYQFFADHLDSPAPAVRTLALRELDRASYDIFSALDLAPEAEPILRVLWQPDQKAFVPIRILLLGLSDDPAAREEVLRGVSEIGRRNGADTLTGPYATALIELDGADGVDHLAEHFLSDSAFEGIDLELVVEAMAIHAGAGSDALRAHILSTLGAFIEARPNDADTVARQFTVRYDFGMGEALQELVQGGRITSARTLIPVSAYVVTAMSGPGPESTY